MKLEEAREQAESIRIKRRTNSIAMDYPLSSNFTAIVILDDRITELEAENKDLHEALRLR